VASCTGADEPEAAAFYVSVHVARRLHYDFRLELGGVLKSWRGAKGRAWIRAKSALRADEDHPLEYGDSKA